MMTQGPEGPTPEDRAAGIAAATDTAIAGALRKLAVMHLGEMDHAHLTLKDGDNVSIVTTDEVHAFLMGWAVRVENGTPL